ncbi:hypothetical protein Godav_028843 [Gossypium davidsonii]|uniref:DELLA protein n=2 Tax=Gossypium TaxID=3633 RepID=A0A7J8TK64_GOSDV|nr:hypothetical protein [Gossypium davidsonii]
MSVFEIHKTSNTKNTTAINHCIAQLGGLASLRGIAISRLTTGSDTSSHKALASFFLSQLLESLTKWMTTMSLRGERLSSHYRFRHQARASVQSLASRTNPPSHVRVTGIGECKQELKEIGDMLVGVAGALNFVDRLEDIRLLMLRVNEESVAMNCVFQLQKTLYDRDGGALRDFLGLIRSTNPTVVTMAKQEAEHNVLSLEARVTNSLRYYSAILDSIDYSLPLHSPVRIKIEEIFAGEIRNLIICDRSNRFERPGSFEKWRK